MGIIALSGYGRLNQTEPVLEIAEKKQYIEIRSAVDDVLLYTIVDKSQIEELSPYFTQESWGMEATLLDRATAQYVYVWYQEGALVKGQNVGEERPYEEIARFVTYSDADYITMIIPEGIMKNGSMPKQLLIFSYKISTKVGNYLNDLSQFEQ